MLTLENIRNSNTLKYVMKNVRLYDANNLNEVFPRKKKADKFEWQSSKPENVTGIKD
ncbi:MAG: hypothetical protein OHK0057_20940 [Thermoflexibacter sp.]